MANIPFGFESLLFLVGFLAGMINAVSGGGSIITLPMLILMGLPAGLANGTNRIGVFFQSLSSFIAYREKYKEFKLSLIFGLLTIPGAIAGALISISLSNALYEKILAAVIILIGVYLVLPNKQLEETESVVKFNVLNVAILLLIGFYGGFMQVGVGFIILAFLQGVMKMDLMRANSHKVFMAFAFTVPSLTIFILAGEVHYLNGLILAVGTSLGAWISSKMAIKKGEKFIKFFLVLSVILVSLKLLKVF